MQNSKLIKTFTKGDIQVRIHARPYKSTIFFDMEYGRTFMPKDGSEVWTTRVPYNQRLAIRDLSLQAEQWVKENKDTIIAAARTSAQSLSRAHDATLPIPQGG